MEKTGVLSACVLKTHLFPEFIYWIVFVMYPGKFFVMNYQGENILQVSVQLIRQALCYPESESYVQFSDDSLITYYDNLAGQEFNQFIHFLKSNKHNFVPDNKEFPMEVFDIEVKPVLRCIAKFLGKDDDSTVDKSILGMFAMMMKPGVLLDIQSYWQEAVNSHLMSLSLTGAFMFPSLIVYLFLYQNLEEFMHLGLNIMDMNKMRQSCI